MPSWSEVPGNRKKDKKPKAKNKENKKKMFWLVVSGGLVWLATKIVGSQDYRNTVHWCYVARHRIREPTD